MHKEFSKLKKNTKVLIVVELLNQLDNNVVEKAAYLARIYNAELHLVHIVCTKHRGIDHNLFHSNTNLKTFALKKIRKLGASLGVPEDNQFVESGEAKDAILALVKNIDAELLLIGNQGKYGVKLFFDIFNSVNNINIRYSEFNDANSYAMMIIKVTERDFAAVINIAGYQRMLSQKMAKESLLVHLGVNKPQNIRDRDNTIELFESNLNNLLMGSKTNNIPKPPNNLVQLILNQVKKNWPDYKDAVSGCSAAAISQLSTKMLNKMDRAVESYEITCCKSGYTEIGPLINLAGYQRMLTQKMAKEVLLIASKIDEESAADSLNCSINRFEQSLNSLLNNGKSIKMSGSKYSEVFARLKAVDSLWSEYKKLLHMNPRQSGKSFFASLDRLSLLTLSEMNRGVAAYQSLAPS